MTHAFLKPLIRVLLVFKIVWSAKSISVQSVIRIGCAENDKNFKFKNHGDFA